MPFFIVIILFFQALLFISFFLNIEIARQIVGFIYLTLIPGFVVLKLLNRDKMSFTITILLSVGLSIAFVMLGGLVINEAGVLLGIKQPLNPTLLILLFSLFVLSGLLISCLRRRHDFQAMSAINFDFKILVLCLLPFLSILGAYVANSTGNTSVFVLALIAILVVVSVTVFIKRLFSLEFYLMAVFAIALALLFQYSLTTNYIQGFDIKVEYYVATLTQGSGSWNINSYFTNAGFGRFYSMLSITVLPTIYSNVLGMSLTWVFKIVYPVIFTIVPVALYVFWRGKFGTVVAFLSAFLFMSQTMFYSEMLGLTRQIIGEVFFVLLLVTLFSKKINPNLVKVSFPIFAFCLIVSHYSTALLFGFFILFLWLFEYLTKKSSKYVSLNMVFLYFCTMFTWYLFTVSSSTLNGITQNLNNIINGFNDFFNPASRGTTVLQGIGLQTSSSALKILSNGIAYTTEFFIIVGFIVLVLHRKKKSFDFEYFLGCTASILLLGMCILLPTFASTLNITRFYEVALFFLAPLFVIGCIELLKTAQKLVRRVSSKHKIKVASLIFMILILGSYFLFQTGLANEFTGSQGFSLPLSEHKLGSNLYVDFWFVTTAQVFSSKWLATYSDISNLTVYADQSSYYNLVSYGGIYVSHVILLTDLLAPENGNKILLQNNEFVYLSELNTLYNQMEFYNGSVTKLNLFDTPALQQLSMIYNNGQCEVFVYSGST